MDLEDSLEQATEDIREAVNSPEHYDFSQRPSYRIPVDPDPEQMKSAVVDLENQNVEVRFEDQKARENYTCVKHDPINDLAIVEGDKVHEYKDTTICSTMHYLIDGDQAYRHTGTGYERSFQNRPVEVADSFEELYRQALSEDNKENFTQETQTQGPEPVPPPEKDSMFPE